MTSPPEPTPAATQPAAEAGEYLLVRVSDELYALPGPAVREVSRWRQPTPIPGAPALLPGIISQRGVVVPIIDLRVLLGLAAAAVERSTRLIITQHENIELALLVDAVIDLVALPPTALNQPPAALDAGRARLLSAVARHEDRPLGVINLAAVIAVVQEGL
jgi:purine-binding chemotaxis protein CheW